jgi:accessory colonization factor AcfC
LKIRIVSTSLIAILFSTIFPSVWIVTAKVANGKETMIGLQPGQNTTRVNSFSYNGVLSISNNNRTSADPQIDISGNNTYVVWSDDSLGNPDIFFTKSTDGGNTFSDKPINLSNNSGLSSDPVLSVRGSNVCVAWHDDTYKSFDILLKKNTDGGNTFSDKPINLSKNKGNSSDPEVFSDEKNDIFVVWDDDSPGNADIFFTKSTDGGETFSKAVNLSNNTRGSFDPALAISKNDIFVAWDDDSPGNADILFTKSTDRGNSFSIKPINLSKNVGRSLYPDVAVSRSNNSYIVWSDDTLGNYEVLLLRNVR